MKKKDLVARLNVLEEESRRRGDGIMNLYKVVFKNSRLFVVAQTKEQIVEEYKGKEVKIDLIEKNIKIITPF